RRRPVSSVDRERQQQCKDHKQDFARDLRALEGIHKIMRNEFAVGDWTAVPSRNLLARGSAEIRIEPRVMDVLVHLAAHADRIVSKEELIEQVWKTRFVTDGVLTVAI